jgi:hypothetical protein
VKRILLLVAVASMLATAMAHSRGLPRPKADPADAQCAKLAIRTLGPSFNPSNYTFIGGSTGNDNFTGRATDGADVFCGFGGDDRIDGRLVQGDIFLGGAGTDYVFENVGTVYGQEDRDDVYANLGTFYGGAGDDFVLINFGTFVQ